MSKKAEMSSLLGRISDSDVKGNLRWAVRAGGVNMERVCQQGVWILFHILYIYFYMEVERRIYENVEKCWMVQYLNTYYYTKSFSPFLVTKVENTSYGRVSKKEEDHHTRKNDLL